MDNFLGHYFILKLLIQLLAQINDIQRKQKMLF